MASLSAYRKHTREFEKNSLGNSSKPCFCRLYFESGTSRTGEEVIIFLLLKAGVLPRLNAGRDGGRLQTDRLSTAGRVQSFMCSLCELSPDQHEDK